jgi:osmotically-inducible protein OsmY
MKRWAIAAALFAITGATAWSAPRAETRAPSTSHDQDLARQILASFLADGDLKNDRIDVTVDATTVTLKGKLGSEAERAKAIHLAQIPGISVVHDQLQVGSRDVEEAVTDTAITTKLKAQFLNDDGLRHATISVTTNNGVVTLVGQVPSRAARAKAVALAQGSRGVTRVEDHLSVSAS